jgi:hypothetical protein
MATEYNHYIVYRGRMYSVSAHGYSMNRTLCEHMLLCTSKSFSNSNSNSYDEVVEDEDVLVVIKVFEGWIYEGDLYSKTCDITYIPN